MEFIETSVFTKASSSLLTDFELRQLQMTLLLHPGMGQVIPGSGGLRKIRWISGGKGKRGGLRVIYYWIAVDHKIYLLYAYSKSKQEDLAPDQIKVLKRLIEED